MEIGVLATSLISVFATVLACFTLSSRQAILFLAVQASAIGLVELIYGVIDLLVGLYFEALIDFLATFIEWFSCAVIIPFMIYWGERKTENTADKPIISLRKAAGLIVAITVVYAMLWISSPLSLLLVKLDVLPFSALMFSLSVLLIVTRRDPLKILVGINMSENAFYPLVAESQIGVVPIMLFLMILANIVGVYIIKEAYREYGTLSITEWRVAG